MGLSQNQYWNGTIKQLRVKTSSYQTNGSTNIDYIVITQAADTSRENWQVLEGWILPPSASGQFNGWEYDENGGQFTLHVSDKTKWWNSSIGQVGLQNAFSSDTQGWSALQSCTIGIVNGALRFTVTGADPAIISPDNLNIAAETVKLLDINLKNSTSATSGRMYFITNTDQQWNEDKAVSYTISPNDSEAKVYSIDMSSNPLWTGTIKRLRWDVVEGASSGTVDINSIETKYRYDAIIVDNKTDAKVSAQKTIPEQTSGMLKWEYTFVLDALPAEGIEWRLADGIGAKAEDAVINMMISGGKLCCINTDGTTASLQSLVARREYKVMVMVNMDTRQYDVWVDGVKKATAKPLINSKTKINKVYIGTTNSGTFKLLFGQTLYKIGYVFDNFYSDMEGNAPVGYAAGGSPPAGAYLKTRRNNSIFSNNFARTSGVDMYNPLSSQNYQIYKTFNAAAGVIEYQTDFMLPVKMDGVSFVLGQNNTEAIVIKTNGGASGSLYYVNSAGAEQKLWDNYKANVCYTLTVKANIITNTASYYVNGVLCASDVPFRNTVSSINKVSMNMANAGHLYLNYIRIAPHYPSTVPYIDAVNNPSTGYVGMQAWQFFSSTYETWDRTYYKLKQSDKTPYLGFIDEVTPEAINWQIKYLAEHGVDFINHFHYRSHSNYSEISAPETSHIAWLDTYLDRCAELSGKVKFSICISAESTRGFGDANEFLNSFLPYLTERYFKNPNYVKYNNKPVIFFYSDTNLAKKFGGTANLKAVLDQAKAWLATQRDSQGNLLGGAIFVAEARPIDTTAARVQNVKNSGFDYVYAYANTNDISTLSAWKTLVDQNGMQAIASPSCMWDNRYWYFINWQVLNTPVQFQHLNKYVKETYWPSYPSSSLASKMVFFDNWAEFGEGHSILPNNMYGFKWLDAIRDVFTTANRYHRDVRPESTYDAMYTKGWKKQLLKNYDFERGVQNWSTAYATLGVVEHREAPLNFGDYDAAAVSLTGRGVNTSSIYQDVTSKVLEMGNGKIYDLSAYIQTQSGRKNAIVYVEIVDDTGAHWFTINGKVDNSTYTKVSGEVKVEWTGKLNYARFAVRGSADDTVGFYVDDCSMKCIK